MPTGGAGHAVYSRPVLAAYDPLVLGLSNRFVWRCPTARLLRHYDEHVTAEHLDVGVGTGWFLDRCTFPSSQPRLVLLDANRNCLAAAASRVACYSPQSLLADVLRPIPYEGEPFASVSLNYLLHCLPGPMSRKASAFDRLKPLLRPGGVLFGSTILGEGVRHGLAGRALMRLYDRRGVFSNGQDSADSLRAALDERFADVAVQAAGCVALFRARRRGSESH